MGMALDEETDAIFYREYQYHEFGGLSHLFVESILAVSTRGLSLAMSLTRCGGHRLINLL